jgi:chaperonin GroEL
VACLRAIVAVNAAMKKAKNDDEKIGYTIVARALEAPAKQIAVNAGFDGDLVVEKVKEKASPNGFGFNASTGEYEDLVKTGIIDPALVVTTALQNAASVAGLMLTTDVIVTELKEDAKAVEEAVA